MCDLVHAAWPILTPCGSRKYPYFRDVFIIFCGYCVNAHACLFFGIESYSCIFFFGMFSLTVCNFALLVHGSLDYFILGFFLPIIRFSLLSSSHWEGYHWCHFDCQEMHKKKWYLLFIAFGQNSIYFQLDWALVVFTSFVPFTRSQPFRSWN